MRCDIYVAPGSWTPEPLARHNFTSSTIMWSISNITSNCVIAMHGKAIKESMTHPEVNGAIATRLYRLHATIETYQVHTSTPYLSTFECLATTSHGKRARSRRYIALIWFNVRRIRWLKLNVTVARSWRKWTAKNENKWKKENLTNLPCINYTRTHTHIHMRACTHTFVLCEFHHVFDAYQKNTVAFSVYEIISIFILFLPYCVCPALLFLLEARM